MLSRQLSPQQCNKNNVTINILRGIKKYSKKTAILSAIAAFEHNNVNESIKYVLTNSVKIVKSAIKNFLFHFSMSGVITDMTIPATISDIIMPQIKKFTAAYVIVIELHPNLSMDNANFLIEPLLFPP